MQELLDTMLLDMKTADDLYRPTNFWSSGLPSIIKDLQSNGFADFREHPSAALFYVPLHSKGIWRNRGALVKPIAKFIDKIIAKKSLETRLTKMLDGTYAAYDDYRLFLAGDVADKKPDLAGLSESTVGGGERFTIGEHLYSKSFLNYLRGLAFLKRSTDTSNLSSVLEIGGGYGTLGEILLKSVASGFYVNVDIPPLAAISTYYLQEVFGREAVLSYEESRNLTEIDLERLKASHKVVVLCPWQLPKVTGQVDSFVNFMSFQEMEPNVVENYIRLVQPLTRDSVLLRNSVHGKIVAHKEGIVGVIQPTTTDAMIAMFDEFRLIGRDSIIFGEESPDRSFRSEVICMERRQG